MSPAIGRQSGGTARHLRRAVRFCLLPLLLASGGPVHAAGVIVVSTDSLLEGALEQVVTLPTGGTTPAVSGYQAAHYLYDDRELLAVGVTTGDVCLADIVVAVDSRELSGGECTLDLYEPISQRFLSHFEFAAVHDLPMDGSCADALAVSGAFAWIEQAVSAGCPQVPPPRTGGSLSDTDGDGVPDILDDFPNDPRETRDTDGDGVGDNADQDDDDDGLPDTVELAVGLNTLYAADALFDLDGDGLDNITEFVIGTALDDPDTDKDRQSDGQEVLLGRNPRVNEGAAIVPGIDVLLLE